MIEYLISITRLELNPEWTPARGPYDREVERYLRNEVTTSTLDADQWRKVQAAIVEALK